VAPRDGPEDNLAKLAISAMRNRDAPVLLFVANQLFARRDFKRAEIALQAALAIDPQSTMAREVLAAVYQVTGRLEEARQQSELAYASCWCIVDKLPSLARKPSVLLAMNRGSEHIPSTHLLPLERYDKVRCLLDCAKWDDGTELPAHDVIFNLLGEPDSLVEPDPSFDELLRRSGRPLLNTPRAVRETRRDRLAARLRGIESIEVPEVHRIEAEHAAPARLAEELGRRGARYPLLVRPAGMHGGRGVLLATEPSQLSQHSFPAASALYATAYRDYRSADGYYRKYRAIFVDRKPLPYHLAISPQWLVHYFSAEMGAAAAKLEEERRFLEAPRAVLGERAYRALEEIGERLALDYAGIDFSLLPDGTLLVFEANATMLVHPEDAGGETAHKNVHVEAILQAVFAMVERRATRK